MSQMLKQAIVDAKALKEAAFKSAEDALLEKYSLQIKEAVNVILEQDEPAPEEDEELGDMFGGAGAEVDQGQGEVDNVEMPLAVADGEQLCACPDEGEEIEIDFDALEQQMRAEPGMGGEETIGHDELAGSLGLEDGSDEELELDEKALFEMLADGDEPEDGGADKEELEEAKEDDDDDIKAGADFFDSLMKKKDDKKDDDKKDKKPSIEASGDVTRLMEKEKEVNETSAGLSKDFYKGRKPGDGSKAPTKAEFAASYHKKQERRKEQTNESRQLAHIKKIVLTETKKIEGKLLNENKKLLSEKKSLIKENKDLNDRNIVFRSKVVELSETLQDINLTNAKLLYTNEVLKSISLNERQKTKIVEAITRTGTVDETRNVYETLIDSVGSTITKEVRAPKSLNEELNKRKTTFARGQRKIANHPEKSRWQALAGIKE